MRTTKTGTQIIYEKIMDYNDTDPTFRHKIKTLAKKLGISEYLLIRKLAAASSIARIM